MTFTEVLTVKQQHDQRWSKTLHLQKWAEIHILKNTYHVRTLPHSTLLKRDQPVELHICPVIKTWIFDFYFRFSLKKEDGNRTGRTGRREVRVGEEFLHAFFHAFKLVSCHSFVLSFMHPNLLSSYQAVPVQVFWRFSKFSKLYWVFLKVEKLFIRV